MLQTVRAWNVDEKNEVICLVSISPSWVMVFKLSKKGHFLQFCADLSNKSKSLKAIYIYASEGSHYTLLENLIVYRGLRHLSWDINDYNIEKDADSAEILRFQTLISPK